jgi:hypothetical protein
VTKKKYIYFLIDNRSKDSAGQLRAMLDDCLRQVKNVFVRPKYARPFFAATYALPNLILGGWKSTYLTSANIHRDIHISL